jgi:hypothetical protein
MYPENLTARTKGASQGVYGKPQGKGMINLVTVNWRKAVETPGPKWHTACKRHSSFAALSFVVRSGDSASLRTLMNVNQAELVKPDGPHPQGW